LDFNLETLHDFVLRFKFVRKMIKDKRFFIFWINESLEEFVAGNASLIPLTHAVAHFSVIDNRLEILDQKIQDLETKVETRFSALESKVETRFSVVLAILSIILIIVIAREIISK
jgi:hypothetical protein